MLKETTLFGEVDKVKDAIELLKKNEPPEGYYLAFSGGKDSVVVKAIADMAGVKYDAHYSVVGLDPPELVQFIKRYHPDVKRHIPPKSIWRLMPEKNMPPTRIVRYCCEKLKEIGGHGRIVLTGIRREESYKRSQRKQIEKARNVSNRILIHPIFYFTEEEVWEFIEQHKLPYCSLYDEGFSRLGCIGCPMGSIRQREYGFERWPKYKENYLRAFAKIIESRKQKGLKTQWQTPEEVMNWWLYGNQRKEGDLFEHKTSQENLSASNISRENSEDDE